MTISSQTRKAGPFEGNDSTTEFPFEFKVFASDEVYVVQADADGVETVLELTSDYTVDLNANQNTNPGGTVVLGSALAEGLSLVVTSQIEYLQPTDLTNQGGFYPSVINNALDRLTMLTQQLKEEVDRSAKLPITNDTDADALVADIVLLADNQTNIDTVAGSITAVQTVAADVTDVNTVAGIAGNVTTVAGIASNVTTVAGISSNVTSVAGNASNINTVAGVSSAVSTVAGISSAVSTVAADGTDIGAVAAISADVQAVADIASDIAAVENIAANVTTVAGISANVTTVAGISSAVSGVAAISSAVSAVNSNATNINAVAADATDIGTVAGISSAVSTVAGISAAVSSVAADATDIGTVATNIANVNAVAGNSSNINAVAANETNIDAVVSNATDIGTVATNIANVNAVAGNSSNINAVAANETNIDAVVSNATNINTVAGIAANVSAVAADATDIGTVATNIADVSAVADIAAAVSTAATNVADISNFADVYQGAKTSNPSTRNDSSALQTGDMYFNSVSLVMRVYNGTAWQDQAASPDTMAERHFLATAGQTDYTFTGGYRVGYTYVWVNGAMLYDTDYTATDGTTITFASDLALDDEVKILSIKAVGSIAVGDISGLEDALDAKASLTGEETLTNKTIDYANNTLTGVQQTLVSGTNIKTVNSTSLLGSGDVAVQPTLVSGTNIKTVNGESVLGSGDIAIAGGLTFNFPYSESITAGDVLQLLSSGEVEKVKVQDVAFSAPSGTVAALTSGDSGAAYSTKLDVDPFNPNRFALAYTRQDGVGRPRICIGTIDGTTVTLSAPQIVYNVPTDEVSVKWNPNAQNKLAYLYSYGGDISAFIGTVDGTTVSFSNPFGNAPSYSFDFDFVRNPSAGFTAIVVVYRNRSGAYPMVQALFSSNGNEWTSASSEYTLRSSQAGEGAIASSYTTNQAMVAFSVYQAGNKSSYVCPITVNNGSISVGSNYEYESGYYAQYLSLAAHPTTVGRYALVYASEINNYYGFAKIVDWNGSSMTIGSSSQYSTIQYTELNEVTFNPSNYSEIVVSFRDGSTQSEGYIKSGTVSGSSITFGSNYTLVDLTTTLRQVFHAMVPGSINKFLYTYASDVVRVATGQLPAQLSNLSASKIIGVAQESGTTGQTKKVAIKGGVDSARTGLTPQITYYVQSNGTVSTASASPAVKLGRALSSTALLLVGEQ